MSKHMTLVAGPTRSAGKKGRAKWSWLVERTIGSKTESSTYDTKAEAKRELTSLIENGQSKGYTVHTRYVETTGYGEEITYHPDGRMTGVKPIVPADGLIGPRCFTLPFTALAKRERAAATRARAKELDGKGKTSKPAVRSSGKPAAAPAAAGSKTPDYVRAFLKSADPAAWLKTNKGLKAHHVARWINTHGTAAQAEVLAKAKSARTSGRTSAPKPPSRTSAPKPATSGTPDYVRAFMAVSDPGGWLARNKGLKAHHVARWITAHGTPVQKARLADGRNALRKTSAPKPSAPRTSAAKPSTSAPKPSTSAPKPSYVVQFANAADPAAWLASAAASLRGRTISWIKKNGSEAMKARLEAATRRRSSPKPARVSPAPVPAPYVSPPRPAPYVSPPRPAPEPYMSPPRQAPAPYVSPVPPPRMSPVPPPRMSPVAPPRMSPVAPPRMSPVAPPAPPAPPQDAMAAILAALAKVADRTA